MNRRSFLLGASALLIPQSARASGTTADVLRAELPKVCGRRAAAIEATLARLARLRPPGLGKTVTVDIPSQQLATYEDGRTVMESRVVIGDEGWRTPDLDTSATYVRLNPTWTVPESIIKARRWRDKLSRNPRYFERLDFRVVAGGRSMSPTEAAERGLRPTSFIQQPSRNNALGVVKIGLAASGSVYLHSTNDDEAFGDDDRAQSHGCIRVEKAMELAGWVLGMSEGEISRLQRSGDRTDRRAPPVRVVTTYFTAWPDASGVVQYYDDIYRKDRQVGRCAGDGITTSRSEASAPTYEEYEVE